MPEQYLFVYGTLRRGSGIPQQRLLRRYAESLGDATINGILFDLGHYPGIALSTRSNDIVSGELYRLKHHHQQELLAQLDEYEECSEHFPQPHEYRRQQVDARLLANGRRVRAWVYVYNRPTLPDRRVASGDYFKR